MNRFDMHIHLHFPCPAPEHISPADALLQKMALAGIAGGCVFSPSPKDLDMRFIPYAARIQALMDWTAGHEDKLFPVYWAHPDEPDAEANIIDAAKRGVRAYKFLADSYYVYEEKCMRLIRLIASLNKPVIFHSGILWYGGETSKYNRPLNWEAMLNVPGLKFSMGHCSWPWHDECIAMYGKFLYYRMEYPNTNPAEMFFDITPGTPTIYRRDLLYKLFNIGYDVKDNVIFGTDAVAPDYDPELAKRYMARDDTLYDELNIAPAIIQNVYEHNLKRFLNV